MFTSAPAEESVEGGNAEPSDRAADEAAQAEEPAEAQAAAKAAEEAAKADGAAKADAAKAAEEAAGAEEAAKPEAAEKMEDLLEPKETAPAPKETEPAPVPAAKATESPRRTATPPIVEAKRESALMQPEPASPVGTGQEDSSPKQQSTAPASPASDVSPNSHSVPPPRDNSGAAEAPRAAWPGKEKGTSSRRAPNQGPKQTSAYQALSTSEYDPTGLPANTGVSESSETLNMTIGGKAMLFPIPTPISKVGSQRKKLREQFNLKEIDVEMIFNEFDLDHNGQLDQKEFRLLLKSFIGRKSGNVTESEYRFVMAVADKDHDQCISKKEVLYGLQAWYAFNYMPIEVNLVLKKYRVSPDGVKMPSIEMLRDLLSDLNGFVDVDIEEVNVVRRIACTLGATDDKVTSEKLRRAIAVWYIHIERVATDHGRLVEHSAAKLGTAVVHHTTRLLKTMPTLVMGPDLEAGRVGDEGNINRLPSVTEGTPGEPLIEAQAMKAAAAESDADDICGGWVFTPLFLWLVTWILPGLYMVHVGGWYPTPVACEHDLAFLIQSKGFLAMTFGFCGLLWRIVYPGHFRQALLVVGALSVVIFIIQDIVGIGLVLSSSPEKCGASLYTVNQFFYVWSFFWFPCFWACCGACCLGFNFLAHFNNIMLLEGNLRPMGFRNNPSTRE
jgi:hypothetical protein